MNCQPSFRTGSVPIVAPALGDLGWHGAEAAAPKRQGPPRRVPDCDIVDVGPRGRMSRRDEPVDVRDLAFMNAASGVAPVRTGARIDARKYMKPALAFLILQATVAGGFYLKKRYAESQVIVIPATIDERAVIT